MPSQVGNLQLKLHVCFRNVNLGKLCKSQIFLLETPFHHDYDPGNLMPSYKDDDMGVFLDEEVANENA